MQEEFAGLDAQLACQRVGLLQVGAAFADGDDVLGIGEGQQLAEAPDAGKVERSLGGQAFGGPASFEEAQVFGYVGPVPVVANVEQCLALSAGKQHFADVIGCGAVGIDTFLVG